MKHKSRKQYIPTPGKKERGKEAQGKASIRPHRRTPITDRSGHLALVGFGRALQRDGVGEPLLFPHYHIYNPGCKRPRL